MKSSFLGGGHGRRFLETVASRCSGQGERTAGETDTLCRLFFPRAIRTRAISAGQSISSRLVPVLRSRTSRVSSTTANVCSGLPRLRFIATRLCRRNRFDKSVDSVVALPSSPEAYHRRQRLRTVSKHRRSKRTRTATLICSTVALDRLRIAALHLAATELVF